MFQNNIIELKEQKSIEIVYNHQTVLTYRINIILWEFSVIRMIDKILNELILWKLFLPLLRADNSGILEQRLNIDNKSLQFKTNLVLTK